MMVKDMYNLALLRLALRLVVL